MDTKKPDSEAMTTAKAVMKRMLATPPKPHKAKVKGKQTVRGKRA